MRYAEAPDSQMWGMPGKSTVPRRRTNVGQDTDGVSCNMTGAGSVGAAVTRALSRIAWSQRHDHQVVEEGLTEVEIGRRYLR
jgi:hypothetical protein